jgi:Xaa-Pro aminopeptidase
MQRPVTKPSAFAARRAALREALARAGFSGAAIVASGSAPSRNYPANVYPFRASSHFLYFVGPGFEGSALLFDGDGFTLLAPPHDPEDALWHGPAPSHAHLEAELGLPVRPVIEAAALVKDLGGVATIPPQDARTAAWLSTVVGRAVEPSSGANLSGRDAALAEAIIAVRLRHDEAAIAQLRHAAAVSAQAHLAGMRATRPGAGEQATYAAMIRVLREAGLDDAYGPIVTVAGEILHQRAHDAETRAGDLLLADVGGETPEGWAADITRTWPVSGTFSKSQRAVYEVVLEAQRRSIAAATPGRSYRDVHETAKRAIVEGLVELGILRGEIDGLLERGAAALFFPHGVGHLLGLDVHDMEDLGDRAGYAPGRERSERFGDAYLRLDRDLAPGMAVTIEPGFYQVPGILNEASYTVPLGDDLRRDVLADYADVRGIRIEDDVLVTQTGNEVLSAGVPKEADEIEAAVRG